MDTYRFPGLIGCPFLPSDQYIVRHRDNQLPCNLESFLVCFHSQPAFANSIGGCLQAFALLYRGETFDNFITESKLHIVDEIILFSELIGLKVIMKVGKDLNLG